MSLYLSLNLLRAGGCLTEGCLPQQAGWLVFKGNVVMRSVLHVADLSDDDDDGDMSDDDFKAKPPPRNRPPVPMKKTTKASHKHRSGTI